MTTLYMLTDESFGDPMVYSSRDAMLADAPRAWDAFVGGSPMDNPDNYTEFLARYEGAFVAIDLADVAANDPEAVELAEVALGCLFSDQDDIELAITNALAEARRIDEGLDALITVAEAAELYQIQPSAVRLACAKGWIPARQSGSTWLMRRADADARWGDRVQA